MIRVRLEGREAWCGRPGCPHPNALATMQEAEDGSTYARLHGIRWRRDGHHEGLEQYITVPRRRARYTKREDGVVERRGAPEWRIPCPAALVCPGCGAVEAIGLT